MVIRIISDEYKYVIIQKERKAIVSRIRMYISNAQPHDEYHELLELSLIFIGKADFKGITFKQPDAMYYSGWLAKDNFSLKVWTFRDNLNLH